MSASEYLCKTCLKELGILLKWRKTLEKFLAPYASSKNASLPRYFSKFSNVLYFNNTNLLFTFMNSKLTDDWQVSEKFF